jgi:tetratricopeptide (TPR) repeat protein
MTEPHATYETIYVDPQHDTEQARKHHAESLAALKHGHIEKAEKHLQEALIADVEFGPAHNNLGQIYFDRKRFYEAAWEFEYASRLMPERAEPLSNLGLVYETVNRFPEAIASFEAARAISPENPEILANLARVRIRSGERTPETAQLLREIEFRDPRVEWRMWARELLHTSQQDLMWASGQAVPDETGRPADVVPQRTSTPESNGPELPGPAASWHATDSAIPAEPTLELPVPESR